ncbi:MAG TPA: hypothetical protein VKR62_03105 [Roseiarcus sp.]|nr:hypothetical protein [Roseiarcus sp.]
MPEIANPSATAPKNSPDRVGRLSSAHRAKALAKIAIAIDATT